MVPVPWVYTLGCPPLTKRPPLTNTSLNYLPASYLGSPTHEGRAGGQQPQKEWTPLGVHSVYFPLCLREGFDSACGSRAGSMPST